MPTRHERYEIELHCGRCRRTTSHLVAVGERSLSRVLCIACGRAVVVDTLRFMEQYVDSVMRRLVAKPFEITTEFTRSPRAFFTSLPSRMLTKPFRVAAELRTTMDIVRLRRRRPTPSTPPPPLPSAPGELPSVERRCRVLLSAPLMWAHPAEEVIASAHDLGYDGVELWAYQLAEDGTDPAAIRAQAQSLGLLLTLHAHSWDLNLSSHLDPIRAASLDTVHRSVALAGQLGAQIIVVHPGRITVPFEEAETYWPRLVASLRDVADDAAARNVQVGVEHMEPRQGEFIVTPEQANRLVAEVDRRNVGTVLDIAHIPWGEDESAFIAALTHVIHVHLSDADESRLHLPLGQGARNLARLLAALRDYRGAMALEGYSIEAGTDLARWNKARFEELWREAAALSGEVAPGPPLPQ
jgi:sugar phosphate isomerase/epimerase